MFIPFSPNLTKGVAGCFKYEVLNVLKVRGPVTYMSTFLLPVKPPGDQICLLEGGARGAYQQNKPISEQLVARPHQVTFEVVGQQGGKHMEGD